MQSKVILSVVTIEKDVEKICELTNLPLKSTDNIKQYYNSVMQGGEATMLNFSSSKLDFNEQLKDVLCARDAISNIPLDAHIICFLNPGVHLVLSPILLRVCPEKSKFFK